jgi:hypothetical protein
MRIRTAAVTVLAVGLLLAGCSSGGDKSDAKSSTAPSTRTASDDKAAVLAAAQAYTKAFFKPDADSVYALLSARCQKGTSLATMRQVIGASSMTYGTPTVKSTEVDSLAGDMARVTVHYVHPPMPEKPQSWTREHGEWKFDNC